MRSFFYIVAVLSIPLLAITFYILQIGERRVIVERISPEKSWRIEILGSQRLFGGIEVTANIYTVDGRKIPNGVINLCDSWKEAEYTYTVSETEKLMIDEVKATFDGRLLIRDHYFHDEEHDVNGVINGADVDFPIGELTRVGFEFTDGTSARNSSIRILPAHLPTDLQPGFKIEMTPDDPTPQAAFVNVSWESDYKEEMKSESLSGKCHLSITITKVTPYVIEGTLSLTAEAPVTELSGNFRLVNHLHDHPDIPLTTELVESL